MSVAHLIIELLNVLIVHIVVKNHVCAFDTAFTIDTSSSLFVEIADFPLLLHLVIIVVVIVI